MSAMVIFGGHVSGEVTNAQHALHINVTYDFNKYNIASIIPVLHFQRLQSDGRVPHVCVRRPTFPKNNVLVGPTYRTCTQAVYRVALSHLDCFNEVCC